MRATSCIHLKFKFFIKPYFLIFSKLEASYNELEILPANSYSESLGYNNNLKRVLLPQRLYDSMKCEYNFPNDSSQMTSAMGRKMGLMLYGDVWWRSPSIKHARYYQVKIESQPLVNLACQL